MTSASELFIGITSWNSALFLPHCLRAVRETTASVTSEIVVLDNCSEDGSAAIARDLGATVLREQCSQADALNRLVARSRASYTLLIHSDVILLDRRWFDLCRGKLDSSTVLVSPEDIGCGPLTRPFGIGKPESSFLFFMTGAFKRLRTIRWRRRWRLSLPEYAVDFYGEHVTHNLPAKLAALGLSWRPMAVHWSEPAEAPIFVPVDKPEVWSEELGFLRYGLGNFYSLDGIITHYHNWYDRIATARGHLRKNDFPPDYIRAYTAAFLRDYEAGRVLVPKPRTYDRRPVAL